MFRLIGYELKKLMGKRTVWILLLLFSVINIGKIFNIYHENSYLYREGAQKENWNTVHWQLYEEMKGNITPESIRFLLEIFHPIESQVAERTASTRLDDPETMTGSIYGDYNLLRRYFVLPMESFYSYGQKAAQAAQAARENAAFYEARGNSYEARKNAWIYHRYEGREIGSFAYMEMSNYYVHYDFSSALILLIGLYGLSGVFAREKESDMEGLLLVHPGGGRTTAAAKVIASGLFLTGVSFWFAGVDFLGFILAFGTMEGLNMPVYAISNFAAASLSVSVGRYLLISALTRALGVWAMGMLFLLQAGFAQNALRPFLTGLLTCLGLVILGTEYGASGQIWYKILNPFSLIQNRILFGRTEFVNLAGFPVPAYAAAIFAAILWGLLTIGIILAFSGRNKLCISERSR